MPSASRPRESGRKKIALRPQAETRSWFQFACNGASSAEPIAASVPPPRYLPDGGLRNLRTPSKFRRRGAEDKVPLAVGSTPPADAPPKPPAHRLTDPVSKRQQWARRPPAFATARPTPFALAEFPLLRRRFRVHRSPARPPR